MFGRQLDQMTSDLKKEGLEIGLRGWGGAGLAEKQLDVGGTVTQR